MSPEEPRRPFRARHPTSTGFLVVAFLATLLLWLQVRPAPDGQPATTTTSTTAPFTLTPTVPSSTR